MPPSKKQPPQKTKKNPPHNSYDIQWEIIKAGTFGTAKTRVCIYDHSLRHVYVYMTTLSAVIHVHSGSRPQTVRYANCNTKHQETLF